MIGQFLRVLHESKISGAGNGEEHYSAAGKHPKQLKLLVK